MSRHRERSHLNRQASVHPVSGRRPSPAPPSAPLLGWFMLAATLIPAGDAVVELRSNGPKAAVYGIHGATAVVMLAISLLLLNVTTTQAALAGYCVH